MKEKIEKLEELRKEAKLGGGERRILKVSTKKENLLQEKELSS